jgi:uncharacterized DUF497 family protein
MTDDDFEWDEDKAARNYAKHGVSFETATLAFEDPFALEWIDDREDYGEERYVVLAMVDGQVLYVAYTEHNGIIRIISARGAEPHERRRYHEDET